MHPSTDYAAELAKKGLQFEPEGEQRLTRFNGKEVGRVTQAEFERIGDLVNGYVQT